MAGNSLAARRVQTFVIAALGAGLFYVLRLPLPLLLGPMLACLIAAFARAQIADFGYVGNFMRTFLGVTVGATINMEVVNQLPVYGLSLMFVPLFIICIGALGYPILRYMFKMNHPTAYYGAMPGGLPDALIVGELAGANVRTLSLVHATRVLVTVTIAPIIMEIFWQADLSQPPGLPASESDPVELLIFVVTGWVGWKLGERIGLFGAPLLGPMILATILSISGVITQRPPAEIIWAAQFFVGVAVGAKYVGVTWREFKVDVVAGFVYALGLALISVAFFLLISGLGIAPAIDAFLAFLPGGQAEIVVIAIIAGADLSYVVIHHLLRLVLVIMLAPFAARILPGNEAEKPQ